MVCKNIGGAYSGQELLTRQSDKVFVFKYIFSHSIFFTQYFLLFFFHTVFWIFILNTFWCICAHLCEQGGLNFLDFASLNNTFKINWSRRFLNDSESIWNTIPNYIFSKVGGLLFLLVSNYNFSKLPIKLSNFHKQVLLVWHLTLF